MKDNIIEESEKDYLDNIQLAENQNVDDDSDSQSPTSEEKRELLKKTKIVKQTWSIQEIYQKFKSGRLDLEPDYQRNVVWKGDKSTAFIESLFMGIIVPPIYVVEILPSDDLLEDSKYEIVDGKQRLTAIIKFLTNKLELNSKNLEYYKDWFGAKKFNDIRAQFQEMTTEMLSSVLDIYVITANSPEFTKYDIFSRLNKGSEKLKVNEIRKAIYRSEVLNQIDTFVKSYLGDEKSEKYAKYVSVFSPNEIFRYDDYGHFYTSIAFFLNSDKESGCVNGYNSRPRDMINQVLQKLQNKEMHISESDLNLLLERTLILLEKNKGVEMKDYIINSCIPFVLSKWEILMDKLEVIVNDVKIKETLKKSPSTTSNVNDRLKRVIEIINL